MKKTHFILAILMIAFAGCTNTTESPIPYDHKAEELTIAFDNSVTIEEAMAFLDERGGEVYEQAYQEGEFTLLAPWGYWGEGEFNVVRVKFPGADDAKLLEMVDEFTLLDEVEFAKPVRIVTLDSL